MIKINDLRTGNILSYKTDEGDMYASIDWQDLKWLTEDSVNFNLAHSAIPLTEDMLLKLGYNLSDLESGKILVVGESFDNVIGYVIKSLTSSIVIKTIHQLQNLYFALKGEELNTTKLTNP